MADPLDDPFGALTGAAASGLQGAAQGSSNRGLQVAGDVAAGALKGVGEGVGIAAAADVGVTAAGIGAGVAIAAAGGPAIAALTAVGIGAAIGNAIPIPGIGAAIGAIIGAIVALVEAFKPAESNYLTVAQTPRDAARLLAILRTDPIFIFRTLSPMLANFDFGAAGQEQLCPAGPDPCWQYVVQPTAAQARMTTGELCRQNLTMLATLSVVIRELSLLAGEWPRIPFAEYGPTTTKSGKTVMATGKLGAVCYPGAILSWFRRGGGGEGNAGVPQYYYRSNADPPPDAPAFFPQVLRFCNGAPIVYVDRRDPANVHVHWLNVGVGRGGLTCQARPAPLRALRHSAGHFNYGQDPLFYPGGLAMVLHDYAIHRAAPPDVRTPFQARALLRVLRRELPNHAGGIALKDAKGQAAGTLPLRDRGLAAEVVRVRELAGERGADPILAAVVGDVTVPILSRGARRAA